MKTEALIVGDYILTTSRSAIAAGIKLRTTPTWNPWSVDYATHAGIVVSVDGRLMIAEMLEHLRLTAFHEYEGNGFWGSRIIAVRRNPVYRNIATVARMNERVLEEVSKAPAYDYGGVISFIWPKDEDRPDLYYCSEYLQHHAILDGNQIISPKWTKEGNDDIPPYGIQCATNLEVVEGWK